MASFISQDELISRYRDKIKHGQPVDEPWVHDFLMILKRERIHPNILWEVFGTTAALSTEAKAYLYPASQTKPPPSATSSALSTGATITADTENVLVDKHFGMIKKYVPNMELWCEILYSLSLSSLHARTIDLFTAVHRRLFDYVGDVPRVRKLFSMKAETEQRYEAGSHEYIRAAQKDGDPDARARMVAVLREKGSDKEAVLLLQQYLADIPSDWSAWCELRKYAIEMNDYRRALFASCQCVILQPNCVYTMIKTGEIYYTIGDFKTARHYYSRGMHIVILSQNRTDALRSQDEAFKMECLWGVWMSALAFQESGTIPENNSEEDVEKNDKMLQWSASALQSIYTASPMLKENESTKAVLALLGCFKSAKPPTKAKERDAVSSISEISEIK